MDVARGTDQETNDAQSGLWNGVKGHAWVDAQAVIDQMFKPLEDLLLEPLSAESGNRVLDVGCGTGGTTLAIARTVGERGRCVGIDLSEPMIAAARERAARDGVSADFICADAQRHRFAPGGFDRIISRFGVMFFDDPVQAFANLRRAARSEAALRFVAWRAAEENPFMTTAERAAAPFFPDLPARRSGAPGQFAFAEEATVRRILEQSGWTGIEVRPTDVACKFQERDLIGIFTRLGPLGQILHEADKRTRLDIVETVRNAFDHYVQDEDVCFTAACWMVEANA